MLTVQCVHIQESSLLNDKSLWEKTENENKGHKW